MLICPIMCNIQNEFPIYSLATQLVKRGASVKVNSVLQVTI